MNRYSITINGQFVALVTADSREQAVRIVFPALESYPLESNKLESYVFKVGPNDIKVTELN